MTRKRTEAGVSAAEYALILAGIAAAIIVVIFTLRDVVAIYVEECAVPGIEAGESDC